jgi:hypothetical protein
MRFYCPDCQVETSLRKVFIPLCKVAYWCPKCHKEIVWTKQEVHTFPREPKPEGPKGREVY